MGGRLSPGGFSPRELYPSGEPLIRLNSEEQLDMALYLNFDMIGSPNAAYFVYDGDDSDGEGAGPGPVGSADIKQTFVDYLASIGVESEGTDFSGRSEYGPFIAVGIPSGGLFTGAEASRPPTRPRSGAGRPTSPTTRATTSLRHAAQPEPGGTGPDE